MFTEFIQLITLLFLRDFFATDRSPDQSNERDNGPQAHLLRVAANDEGRHDRVYLDRCRNSDFVRS